MILQRDNALAPEEGLGRNGVDEPLEQLARSLPAVVHSRQVTQQSIKRLAVSINTLFLLVVKHKGHKL